MPIKHLFSLTKDLIIVALSANQLYLYFVGVWEEPILFILIPELTLLYTFFSVFALIAGVDLGLLTGSEIRKETTPVGKDT